MQNLLLIRAHIIKHRHPRQQKKQCIVDCSIVPRSDKFNRFHIVICVWVLKRLINASFILASAGQRYSLLHETLFQHMQVKSENAMR